MSQAEQVIMTDAERIAWITNASYEDMLRKWRFERPGSPWFRAPVSIEFYKRFFLLRANTPQSEQVAASKRIGWITAIDRAKDVKKEQENGQSSPDRV